MMTLAVMFGRSACSGFGTSMITGYVTTFWFTVAFSRICEIVPRKIWSG